VVTPNHPHHTIRRVAEAYGIEWLVVEPHDSVPALEPVVAGARPPWIGPPVVTIPGPDGKPAEIVYPVCVSPQDQRCATVASAAAAASAAGPRSPTP
jgi:hypothetical protein